MYDAELGAPKPNINLNHFDMEKLIIQREHKYWPNFVVFKNDTLHNLELIFPKPQLNI